MGVVFPLDPELARSPGFIDLIECADERQEEEECGLTKHNANPLQLIDGSIDQLMSRMEASGREQ